MKLADHLRQVVAQETGVVPVARGVDADADAHGRRFGARRRRAGRRGAFPFLR